MTKKVLTLVFSLLMFALPAQAQSGEVIVSFNEQFFDAVLDAIFKNLKQPEFPLAANHPKSEFQNPKSFVSSFDSKTSAIQNPKSKIQNPLCDEKIVLQREMGGVRTSVRLRDGRISAPIAFSGVYNPPLIGCIEFQGIAETTIDLEFDRERQALVGWVRVQDVQLGNVANLAGGFIARMVQSSIDKRINPIEILRADRLSFVIPVQNSGGSLNLKAKDMRPEIGNGSLSVHINFEFSKAQ